MILIRGNEAQHNSIFSLIFFFIRLFKRGIWGKCMNLNTKLGKNVEFMRKEGRQDGGKFRQFVIDTPEAKRCTYGD